MESMKDRNQRKEQIVPNFERQCGSFFISDVLPLFFVKYIIYTLFNLMKSQIPSKFVRSHERVLHIYV